MCDQDQSTRIGRVRTRGLVTRRQFGALLGAGMAILLPQVANAVAVTESDVNVKTPDGTADCYFVHPATGTGAGVLMWPDIFGLRPAFRQMGKRLAESGYSVLVVITVLSREESSDGRRGAKTPMRTCGAVAQGLNETTQMTDARAFIGGSTSNHQSRETGRWARRLLHGRPIAFRTAVAMPDRIGAVDSFHGVWLATEMPNSPHLKLRRRKRSSSSRLPRTTTSVTGRTNF